MGGMTSSAFGREVKLGCSARAPRHFARYSCRALLGAALFFLGLVSQSFAASQSDPCNSLSFKQSAAISVSTATTTTVVTGVANKPVFVCGFAISIAGSASTASTASFEYSPNSACSSSTTALTGTFGSNDAAASTTPTVVSYGDAGSTIMTAPAGDYVCIVTSGNSVAVNGTLSYVVGSGQSFP